MEAAPSRGDGDILRGNGSDNLIRGLDGGDLLDGRGGNDDLQGGDGNDILIGGAGVDKLQGGSGEDIFRFNDGHSGTYVASLSSISTSRGAVSGASGPVSGATWNEFEPARTRSWILSAVWTRSTSA